MASNYKHPGDVLDLTAPAGGVVSGSGYLVGGFFVVATRDADADEEFQGQMTGVWELPKLAGLALDEGDIAYWDETPGEVNATDTNPKIGAVVKTAADSDTVVWVRLDGISIG